MTIVFVSVHYGPGAAPDAELTYVDVEARLASIEISPDVTVTGTADQLAALGRSISRCATEADGRLSLTVWQARLARGPQPLPRGRNEPLYALSDAGRRLCANAR